MEILIRGGRVIDPAQGIDRHLDVWIVDGKVAELGVDIRAPLQRVPSDPRPEPRIIEAPGCVVAPGFLDMHVHLREPGFEHKKRLPRDWQQPRPAALRRWRLWPIPNP